MRIKNRLEKIEELMKADNAVKLEMDPFRQRLINAVAMHPEADDFIRQGFRYECSGDQGAKRKCFVDLNEWYKRQLEEYLAQGGADDAEAFLDHLEMTAKKAMKMSMPGGGI